MNRRSFLSKLAMGSVALSATIPRSSKPKINPAWENANGRIHFLCSEDAYRAIEVGKRPPLSKEEQKRLFQLIGI